MRKHVIPVLLTLFCTIMTLALPITAAGANEGNSDLTLHYYITGQARPLSGVTFYLYRVGEYVSGPVNGTYNYRAAPDFEDAKVELTGLNFWTGADHLTNLVNVLVPYTEMYKETVKPAATAQTNGNGDLTFRNLAPGLYLVWGETLEVTEPDGNGGIRQWTFIPQAFLIPLPYPMRDGSFNHKVEADVKYEQLPPPAAEYIEITVQKKWGSEGKSHPDSVTVELLRNGTVTKEEILHAGNRWTHTWTGLDSSFRWEVAEKDVPDGYTVSVNRDGYHFTITNKSTEPGDPPPPSEGDPTPDTPTPDTPTPENPTPDTPMPDTPTPDTPTPDNPTPDNPLDGPGLPQTGQLWWPVPLLVVVGVPLLLIGAVLFVRKDKSEEFKEPYE